MSLDAGLFRREKGRYGELLGTTESASDQCEGTWKKGKKEARSRLIQLAQVPDELGGQEVHSVKLCFLSASRTEQGEKRFRLQLNTRDSGGGGRDGGGPIYTFSKTLSKVKENRLTVDSYHLSTEEEEGKASRMCLYAWL